MSGLSSTGDSSSGCRGRTRRSVRGTVRTAGRPSALFFLCLSHSLFTPLSFMHYPLSSTYWSLLYSNCFLPLRHSYGRLTKIHRIQISYVFSPQINAVILYLSSFWLLSLSMMFSHVYPFISCNEYWSADGGSVCVCVFGLTGYTPRGCITGPNERSISSPYSFPKKSISFDIPTNNKAESLCVHIHTSTGYFCYFWCLPDAVV